MESLNAKVIYVSEFVRNCNSKTYHITRKLFGKGVQPLIDFGAVHKIEDYKPNLIIAVCMNAYQLRDLVPTLRSCKEQKVIYCFDTWTTSEQEWKSAIEAAGIDHCYLAYLSSVKRFQAFVKHVQYLPQAFNEKVFYPRTQIRKTRLFMQMGRKNNLLHEFALKYIYERHLSENEYIYEKKKGEVIFPDFNDLATEICHTKFFLCAPRDIDEVNVTGDISDVTARYYEGIACKTMIVGFKPKDTFDMLFPYSDAMKAVSNYEEFRAVVDYYLSNEAEYNQIVDMNYKYIMSNHTWKNRAAYMKNDLHMNLSNH